MNIAEQLVERFLTQNGAAFACPQFNLQKDGDRLWRATFDFVVLDFAKRHLIAVEVSESGRPGSVERGARHCLNHGYFELLAIQLEKQTHGATCGWPVFFLGFLANEDFVKTAYKKFEDKRIFFRPLSDTIDKYWDIRQLGLLPPRPA